MSFIDRIIHLLEAANNEEANIDPALFVIRNYKHQDKFLSVDGKQWYGISEVEGGKKIKTFTTKEAGKKWVDNLDPAPKSKGVSTPSGTIDYPKDQMDILEWENFIV